MAVGHEADHVVAADAGHRAAALGHPGRGVVGAAGAEGGHPVDGEHAVAEQGLLGLQEGQPLLDVLRREEAPDAPGDHLGDHRRGQLAGGGQQPVAVVHHDVAVGAGAAQQRPLALLVELADHPRAHVLAPVVELFLELVFDELALLLDHQDLVEALGEAAHPVGLEGPHHAHLVEPDADLGGEGRVDAQVVEGLAHVEVALAGGDDAQPRLRRVDHHPVEPVGAAVGQRRVELVVEQALLLHQRRVGPAQVEAAVGHLEVVGFAHHHPHRVHVHRGRGLDGVGHRLEGHPAARPARQRPAMHAEVEVLLHPGRGQHRHHHRLEEVVGLVGQGGRLGRVIVAGDRQHAAKPAAAGGVGVAEHVAAAVHPRPLAVPHREHPLHPRLGRQGQLLGAPHRGGGQVFVDAGLEHDVVLGQMVGGLPQAEIQPAQRRAPVAGHEAGGVEPGGPVALPLDHRQAHQRLVAGEIHAAGFGGVFVVQGAAADGAGVLLGHGELLA